MDILDKIEMFEAYTPWKGARSYARQKYQESIPKQLGWRREDWNSIFKEAEKDFRSNQKDLIDKTYPKTVKNAIDWVNKNIHGTYGKDPYQKARNLLQTAYKKMTQSYDEKAIGKEAFWTIANKYIGYIIGSLEMIGYNAL